MHFAHWSRSGITSLIKALAGRRGDSFALLLDDDNFEVYYSEIKHKVRLRFGKRNLLKSILSLRKFYRQQNPGIVHAHSLTPLIFAYILCMRSKLVFHVHNEYPYLVDGDLESRLKRWILYFCLHTRNIKIVTVTRGISEIFWKKFRKESDFIPNGIPDNGGVRPSFSDISLRNRFYSACRIESQKNLKMAIKIIGELRKKYKVVYHIYGEGPEKKELVELVDHENLNETVIFKGFVNAPQDLAKDYDFYLSCSRYEGLSLSIADALRGGNIAIITPVGELKNYITDTINGFFIDHNINSAAQKIETLLTMDFEDLNAVQKNGRELFKANFTDDKFYKNIEIVYNNI